MHMDSSLEGGKRAGRQMGRAAHRARPARHVASHAGPGTSGPAHWSRAVSKLGSPGL